MLYHLLYPLRERFGALNVFGYLTFRSMLAFLLAFLFVLIFQPRFIRWIQNRYMGGQPIRDDGPQSHFSKKGTPTMGGVVVVVAVATITFLLGDLTNSAVWVILFVMLGYGGLGFVDDYRKVVDRSSKGISARTKLRYQFGIAIIAMMFLVLVTDLPTTLSIPFFKHGAIDLGWLWFILFGAVVIVGASNAVNLTDGLDGLVIGPVMTTAFAYGVFAYVSGNVRIAEYLQIPYIAGAADLSIFAAALIASGLGFLWYNSFPAQVFMGDVGALALGGGLGILAVVTKQEILLLVAGGVFVLEALSVIIQVASFKITGKRVFRMAPLHHHFELAGLSEPKIIVRCWIISIILAIISLTTLKLR